jgi:hydrogenase-4 membrane subunit HyfE
VTLDVVLFLAGAGLVLEVSTARAVVAYVILTAIVSAYAAPATLHSPLTFALFAVSLALKLILAPLGIWLFVRRNAGAVNLRPALALPARLIVVLALAFASQAVAHVPGLAAIPMAPMAAYVILCGLAVLVIQRNLLAQVIGVLVLGTGVTLAGIVTAPQLPETIELGATFDALVVTFIGLALVRAVLTHNPILDSERLRSLRG